MKTNYLSLLIICLLFFGKDNTFAENSGSIMEVRSQIEHDHEKGSEKLELNNGEKWN